MKTKIAQICTVLFVLSAALFSCSNDDTPKEEEQEGITNWYITAKIDGVEKTIDENTIDENQDVIAIPRDDESGAYFVLNTNPLNIQGVFSFGLTFPRSKGTFSATGVTGFSYSQPDESVWPPTMVWSAYESNGSPGSITITEINDRFIEGTFFFTGESLDGRTIVVTEGEFRAFNHIQEKD